MENTMNIEMENFFETTICELDEFDTYCWHKGVGYTFQNYPIFNEKMEGLEAGLYIFAGESNSGKSAIMLNMLYDICTNDENDLFGLYVSLDDSKYEIIPRVIAMTQRIPIGAASKPQRYQQKIDNKEEGAGQYQEWLNKRAAGIDLLKQNSNRFKVVDGNKIKNAEQLKDYIAKLQIFIKAHNPDANLIVAIDALNDIRFANKPLKPGNELNSAIAREVKDWAVEFDIPIFGSCHLRKLNGNRRPTADDLKESSEYIYEASAVFLVHNDVSKNKQSATIYYNQDGVEEKRPIIELDWAKNKKSSFKGRTYYYFAPEMSLVTECSRETMRRFDALIYEN